MYFGNSDGLLEYDGVTWRMLRFEENSFVRSLAIGIDRHRRERRDSLFLPVKRNAEKQRIEKSV